MDSKPIFSARKGKSDFSSSSFLNTSVKNSFRGQVRIVNCLQNPPEGVVVDEGNDHIRVIDTSLRGHLLLYHKVWLANKCPPRVAHILKHGYEIILKSPVELL